MRNSQPFGVSSRTTAHGYNLRSRRIDIERIHKQGKIAVIESFLNARSLGKDLAGIDELYQAGVRVFGLTHAGNNDFADSSRPQDNEGEEHHGLSPLGKQAIARLNALGVLIDVSQLTPAGVFQVLRRNQRRRSSLPTRMSELSSITRAT